MMRGRASITIGGRRIFEGNSEFRIVEFRMQAGERFFARLCMSVLAIDIGNTRIGFNVFTHGKAQDAAVRIAHADLDEQLVDTLKTLWEKAQRESKEAEDDVTEIVIASVVMSMTMRV